MGITGGMSFYHSVKDTPPPFFKDFYDRLFWYGFDSTETTSAADKTMFGVTRGKFHGLDLLQDFNTNPIKSTRRRN